MFSVYLSGCHNYLMIQVFSFLIHRWGKWDSEKGSDLPKTALLISGQGVHRSSKLQPGQISPSLTLLSHCVLLNLLSVLIFILWGWLGFSLFIFKLLCFPDWHSDSHIPDPGWSHTAQTSDTHWSRLLLLVTYITLCLVLRAGALSPTAISSPQGVNVLPVLGNMGNIKYSSIVEAT